MAFGAAVTSFLATRFGFPVSTTHALVGALVGGCLCGGGLVNWVKLSQIIMLPLLISPLLAAISGYLIVFFLRKFRMNLNSRTKTLDRFHFLCSGAASFARGLNDTPKMAALLLIMPGLQMPYCFLIVAIMIALGGLTDYHKVGETLGKKITGMMRAKAFLQAS